MKKTEFPAFPSCVQYFTEDTNYVENQGMNLHDYMAAKAMQGIISQAGGTAIPSIEDDPIRAASISYRMADAMLAEREK